MIDNDCSHRSFAGELSSHLIPMAYFGLVCTLKNANESMPTIQWMRRLVQNYTTHQRRSHEISSMVMERKKKEYAHIVVCIYGKQYKMRQTEDGEEEYARRAQMNRRVACNMNCQLNYENRRCCAFVERVCDLWIYGCSICVRICCDSASYDPFCLRDETQVIYSAQPQTLAAYAFEIG